MSVDLCEDLIFEIFSRLPPKSLVRFRSLSKSISSSIASPIFISMHTFQSPQKVLIQHMVLGLNGLPYFYTLHTKDQLPTPHRRYIGIKAIEAPYNIYSRCVGSCNGIICLIDDENCISLWNPSIRRKLILPDCLERCSCGAHRVWIGPGTIFGIGFGFDPITDEYKIVILLKCGETGVSSYVYTLKTGDWGAITSPTPLFFNVTSHGCFVNGALHWVVQRHFPESDDVNDYYILTFDLSAHVFGRIALPEPSWKTEQLMIIQGSLAVIYSKDDYSRIWVMREYSNTDSWSNTDWSVVFKKEMYLLEGALERVLQPTSNSDSLLFKTKEQSFQVYDLKTRARSTLWNFYVDSFIIDIETYVESLHLLDMGTACQPSIHEEKKSKTTKVLH